MAAPRRRPTPVQLPLATAALILTVALSACDPPRFEGPEIQSPPPAFYLQPEAYQARRMFPNLEIVHHGAWVETSSGLFSGIYINGHAGVLTEDDAYAAQDSARAVADRDITFGGVEVLTIDGRRAWGWAERLETPQLGIDWVAYRAVIPYDKITYAVEFYGNEPGLKRAAPDTLRTIVASFAVGKTVWDWPLILALMGATVLAVSVARSRARARAMRLQSISLRKISKEEDKEGEAAAGGDGPGQAGGGAGGPPAAGEGGAAPAGTPGVPPSGPPDPGPT